MVQQGIAKGEGPLAACLVKVKGIMAKHDDESDSKDGGEGQPNGKPEEEHADTDGPECFEEHDMIARIEAEDKGEDSYVDEDQPESAADEEAAKLGPGFAQALKIARGACQEYEDGCAEMGDPASEEQSRRGGLQIQGIAYRIVKVVARMIERHNDHDQSAEQVDRVDAVGAAGLRTCWRWRCGEDLFHGY